jgi:hypothetical protein
MAITKVVSGGENGFVNVSFHGTPAAAANEIVAAPGAGKSIRVYAFDLIAAGADNVVNWTTGSSSHFGASGAAMTLNVAGAPASQGIVKPFSPAGYFTGGANESLALTCSTTTALFGQLTYKVIGSP